MSAGEETPRRSGWLTSLAGLPGILALAVLLLDQLTKFLVCRICPNPGAAEYVVIPGFFKLVHWRNTGAAWGIFAEHTWLLTAVSLLAAAAVVIFFKTITEGKPRFALPFGVLLGGIVGNLIDRAFFSAGVVDFLAFGWWPAFNIADSAICCSVIWIVVTGLFFSGKSPAK